MGFLKKLFGKAEPAAPAKEIEKDIVPVYPMIKDSRWQGMPHVVHYPFVRNGDLDLDIVFAQDAGDRFEYIRPADLENPAIKANFDKWKENIDHYPYEFIQPDVFHGKVAVAEGLDHSSEKMLCSAFLSEACKLLNTDKLIISATRRRFLMMTSYYGDFQTLESFFLYHFSDFRNEQSGNEVITEMVFVADASRVLYAVPLGFRMNVYEKDGETRLVYSTMEDLYDEEGQLNFRRLIENKKTPVLYPAP